MIVKVCGVTCEDDALASIEAGAGALGFNFWPGSPRFLPRDARGFVPRLSSPSGEPVWKVGVFVDASPEVLARTVGELGLDVIQLHGAIPSPLPPGIRLWRARPVREGFDPASLDDPAAEAYLLDTPAGAMHGGTGQPFDWTLIRGLRRKVVLAGGLDASNVAEAIRVANPWGVDACSRLESYPGKKDHRKVAAFVAAARSAAASARRNPNDA